MPWLLHEVDAPLSWKAVGKDGTGAAELPLGMGWGARASPSL